MVSWRILLIPATNLQQQHAICFIEEASTSFGSAGIIAWQHIRSSKLANPLFVIRR